MKRSIMFFAASATAMLAAGSAYANCKQELTELPRNFATAATEDSGMTKGQIRRLHNAAKILARNGYEDACSEVVDVLRGDADRDEQASLEADGDRIKDAKNVRKAEAAEPVIDADGNFSTNGMIGSEVYSSTTGEAIGDIEDILMGRKNQSVVIGHGGMLGLGEKRIKVALDDLKVHPQDNTYYLAMTPSQIEGLPAVVKKDNRWVVEPADAKQRTGMTSNKSYKQASKATSDRDNDTATNRRSTEKSLSEKASETMKTAQHSAEKLMRDAKQAGRNAADAGRDAVAEAKSNVRKDSLASGLKGSTVSSNELVGSWVYTSAAADGSKKVGEIEDLIVDLRGPNHSIVLGHGGFLGLGEKRIKINISDLDYDAAQDRYFVNISENQLKRAAGLEKVDDRWVGEPVSAQDRTYKKSKSDSQVQ